MPLGIHRTLLQARRQLDQKLDELPARRARHAGFGWGHLRHETCSRVGAANPPGKSKNQAPWDRCLTRCGIAGYCSPPEPRSQERTPMLRPGAEFCNPGDRITLRLLRPGGPQSGRRILPSRITRAAARARSAALGCDPRARTPVAPRGGADPPGRSLVRGRDRGSALAPRSSGLAGADLRVTGARDAPVRGGERLGASPAAGARPGPAEELIFAARVEDLDQPSARELLQEEVGLTPEDAEAMLERVDEAEGTIRP